MARLYLLIFLMIAGAGSAWAHSIEWINGRTYDYPALTAGRNCCTDVQRECRPAFEYWRVAGGWKLRIPRDGGDPKSGAVVVFVAETNVIYQDLAGDGVAHTCGGFTINGQWGSFCTFIPPGQTSEWRPRGGAPFIFSRRYAYSVFVLSGATSTSSDEEVFFMRRDLRSWRRASRETFSRMK
jgi:hypothetical protein